MTGTRTAGADRLVIRRRLLLTVHEIAYRATLDVPRELVQFVAKLLRAERHRRGTPWGSRALTCFWQAVLGLRWFRDRTTAVALAGDHGISRATAYRYLDEVVAVLASEAPELRQALERAKNAGLSHMILDGKIVPADRWRNRPSAPGAWSSTCGIRARLMRVAATSGGARPGRLPSVGLGR